MIEKSPSIIVNHGMCINFVKTYLDFIIPPQCLMCRKSVQGAGYLCSDCFKKLNFITEPSCQKCGAPFPYEGMTGSDCFCMRCRNENILWQKGKAAFVYNEGIKQLILPLKYADQHNAVRFFVNSMKKYADSLITEADFIVPVPLHKKRLQQRKYNQSALLAWQLGKEAKKIVLPMAINKIKNTPPLGHFNKQDRQNILKNVFNINPKFKNMMQDKTVLLIDDVMTTGSTLNACSHILLDSGVKQINVLVIAKVDHH